MKTLVTPKEKSKPVETTTVEKTEKKSSGSNAIIWVVVLLVLTIVCFIVYNYINSQKVKIANEL